jgi:predicted dehydrogenase
MLPALVGRERTVDIALVGTGKVAERNYIPSLIRHDDVSLTCYSRTKERADAVGGRFGVGVAGTLEELLAPEPEAVFVLTGEQDRLEAVRALLPFAPRRLFLEKPLVARGGQANVVEQDFWDGKALLEEAAAAGVDVAMVFNYRFFDQTQRARRLIEERNLGAVTNVVALSHFATWSHCIDLILWFAGSLHQVSAHQGAHAHTHPASGTAADVSSAFLIGEGASGTLLGTNAIDWGFPLFELVFGFERGRIHLRGLDQEMELLDAAGDVHEIFTPTRDSSRWDKYDASFEKSIDAYLESIRTGAAAPVPGVAGLLELQFEASLKRSIAEQRTVVPADEFPIDPVR